MDLEFDHQWRSLLKAVEQNYGEELDLNAILFLIGVQELGDNSGPFKKREKLELMHIAVCTLLEPYGYYSSIGRDKDGWPHFEKNADLPALVAKEQERLIKEAILIYFENADPI